MDVFKFITNLRTSFGIDLMEASSCARCLILSLNEWIDRGDITQLNEIPKERSRAMLGVRTLIHLKYVILH